MRGSVSNPTTVLCCNTANSSLTIGVKNEILINELAQCRNESEVLRNPALHIAKPLGENIYMEIKYEFNEMSFMQFSKCEESKNL